jgi:hypothetical protein
MKENKLTNERYIYLDLSNPICFFLQLKLIKRKRGRNLLAFLGYEILMARKCGGKELPLIIPEKSLMSI